MSDQGQPVRLRIYDLSRGMAAQFSMAFIGKQIDLVPHTGVEVFGYVSDGLFSVEHGPSPDLPHRKLQEYFFGGGIQRMPSAVIEAEFQMRPAQVIEVGRTTKSREAFEHWLRSVTSQYTMLTCTTAADRHVKLCVHSPCVLLAHCASLFLSAYPALRTMS